MLLGIEESGVWHTAFSIVWSRTQGEVGLGATYLGPPIHHLIGSQSLQVHC